MPTFERQLFMDSINPDEGNFYEISLNKEQEQLIHDNYPDIKDLPLAAKATVNGQTFDMVLVDVYTSRIESEIYVLMIDRSKVPPGPMVNLDQLPETKVGMRRKITKPVEFLCFLASIGVKISKDYVDITDSFKLLVKL